MRSGFCVRQSRGLEKRHQVSLCYLIYISVVKERTETVLVLFLLAAAVVVVVVVALAGSDGVMKKIRSQFSMRFP